MPNDSTVSIAFTLYCIERLLQPFEISNTHEYEFSASPQHLIYKRRLTVKPLKNEKAASSWMPLNLSKEERHERGSYLLTNDVSSRESKIRRGKNSRSRLERHTRNCLLKPQTIFASLGSRRFEISDVGINGVPSEREDRQIY